MSDNPFCEEDAGKVATPVRAAAPQKTVARSGDAAAKLEQLRLREQELYRRQEELNVARTDLVPQDNYPAWYPVLRFDLEADIPLRAHLCLKASLYGMITLVFAVFVNVVAVLFVSGHKTFRHIRSLIFALIQSFGTTYVVYNYSFQKLYQSCRRADIPFSWVITQFIVVPWLVYLTIGFPNSGSVGLATFLDLLAQSKSKLSMLIAFINTLLIGIAAFLEFVTLYKAQQYQKISGADELPPGREPQRL
jgi:uncharacterized membrane protein YkvI